MKTLMTAVAILAMAISASGQAVKKDTSNAQKPQFEKFIKVSQQDYSTLLQFASGYAYALKWNPAVSAEQKIKEEQQIEIYLKQLFGRVAVDSALVKK